MAQAVAGHFRVVQIAAMRARSEPALQDLSRGFLPKSDILTQATAWHANRLGAIARIPEIAVGPVDVTAALTAARQRVTAAARE